MSIYTSPLGQALRHGFDAAAPAPSPDPQSPAAPSLKSLRHDAIRGLIIGPAAAASQHAILRKLADRNIHVTQATLSRDIREMRLMKGPTGYFLPSDPAADGLPQLASVLSDFGMEVRQAANLLVFITIMGGAQPIAASLDQAAWPEIVGTIAGDDTVLIICADTASADTLRARIEALIA